jgi:hypothetical protein
MKFAYADPPYVGQAKKHYRDDPNCCEVNHRVLIETLLMEFPDGWALSCLPRSLKELLCYCPDDVRVMPWVKTYTPFKKGVNPAYAWEPVVVCGGRRRTLDQRTIPDYVIANTRAVTPGREPKFSGQKPPAFCYWLFEVLNMNPDDEFMDIFPGSGAVGLAWELWRTVHCRRNGAQLRLIPESLT